MNANRKIYFLSILIVLSCLLAACGNQPQANGTPATPVAMAPTRTVAPAPTATAFTGHIKGCGTAIYITEATVSAYSCNDRKQLDLTILGQRWRIYFGADPQTVIEGNPTKLYSYFAGLDQNDQVIMNGRCSMPAQAQATGGLLNESLYTPAKNETIQLSCYPDDAIWAIYATIDLRVASASNVDLPPAMANIVPWKYMQEGQYYGLCSRYSNSVTYTIEGNNVPYYSHSTCIAGKLLNRTTFRIWWQSKVVTLDPNQVLGGYPFIDSKQFVPGVRYYACTTDLQSVSAPLDTGSTTHPLMGCLEGVYLQATAGGGIVFYVNGQLTNFSGLTAAFQSPQP